MVKELEARQFTPTAWHTAETKAKFARHFLRFIDSGFKATLFFDWFYRQLSMTFGHIAHYNRGGFFNTFFADAAGKARFLRYTLGYNCCGDPKFTYSDVERQLQQAVLAGGYLEKYETQLADDTEAHERAVLARLKAKYERKEAQ